MNEQEQALAEQVYSAIQSYSKNSERSRSTQVGISSLGHCSALVQRIITEEPPTDDRDVLAAFLGTAVGDFVEKAVKRQNPNLITQTTVTVKLKGEQGDYELKGHPDVLDPDWGVWDGKTRDGLGSVRSRGPSQQQMWQRNLYVLGAWQMGYFNKPLEELMTGNVWVDRSGREHECFAHVTPFSWAEVDAATYWLDEIVYNVKHGIPARKEPNRSFCESYCEHFTGCRAGDTDVEGLITDPETLAAVDLYRSAVEMEKQVKAMKKEANNALVGVSGSTGEFLVRNIYVNGGHVEYDRQGSWRLSVTRAAGRKKPPPQRIENVERAETTP